MARAVVPYLWFHAFRRDNIQDVIRVLADGPTPLPGTNTARNEQLLGIEPPRVYAYLGQTFEEFGDSALSLQLAAMNADAAVSPFDTGGLIHHIVPVRDWTTERRRAFLNHYSWPATEMATLVNRYPSDTPEQVSAYLRGDRPVAAGPHELFEIDAPADTRVAAIWQNGTSVRAWLWEARAPGALRVNAHLEKWSCSPSTYQALLRYEEELEDENLGNVIAQLRQRYVPGGVAALVVSLMSQQEAA